MDGLSFALVKSPNATLNDGVVELLDENRCIVQMQVLVGGKLSNSFEIEYGEECAWVTPRRDYVAADEVGLSNLTLYIDGNTTKNERYYGFSIINNMSGECVNMTVYQPACKYVLTVSKIEIWEDGEEHEVPFSEHTFEDGQEIPPLVVTVGGASKSAVVGDGYLDIVMDGEIYDYDNCLSYTMVLDKEKSTGKFNKYDLKIKCLGRFMDTDESYYVNFPVIHKSNPEVVVNLKLNIGLVGGSDAEANFEEEYDKQDGLITTARERNEENKRNSMINVEVKVKDTTDESSDEGTITPSRLSLRRMEVEGLAIENIEGNKITLQTNVYNRDGEIENDSMLVLQPNAVWCRPTSEWEDGLHYVTVGCDKNYWNKDRSTKLVIRNAEDYRSSKTFLITQKPDSSVEIGEYVNS